MAMEAHAILCYGVMMCLTKCYLRAGYHIRRAWQRFEEAFKLMNSGNVSDPVPENVRGLIGFGVAFFNFGVSMVPPQLE